MTIRLLAFAFFMACAAEAGDATLIGVFEGRTPCGALAVEFTGFPSDGCEKIKWRLTLRRGTFLYEGTRSRREGTWTTMRGTARDRDAVVYKLTYAQGRKWIAFQKVDDDILLLLDRQLRPVPGDASWSYTLSRTDSRRR